jgi:hypothetical protein
VGGLVPVYEGENKTLSLSAAYAVLDGEIDLVDEFTGVSAKIAGDTTGFSYAAILNGVISSQLTYTLTYKVQDYFFEGSFSGGSVGVDKNFTQLQAGLTYFF